VLLLASLAPTSSNRFDRAGDDRVSPPTLDAGCAQAEHTTVVAARRSRSKLLHPKKDAPPRRASRRQMYVWNVLALCGNRDRNTV
jgi:hypothetical protein